MNNRLTRFEKINVINIFMTLLLSGVALVLAYNSYKISENTFRLSESIETLNTKQANIEFKSSVLALFTTIDIQIQKDPEGIDLSSSINSLKEMKLIVEGQLKNLKLAQDRDLSNLWIELYSRLNFIIKFFEEGLKANSTVSGIKENLADLKNKTNKILNKTFEFK